MIGPPGHKSQFLQAVISLSTFPNNATLLPPSIHFLVNRFLSLFYLTNLHTETMR
jgi:hypothetical protein